MIFYAHVNEDNLAERNAMFRKPVNSLCVIAGSGERVLALLDHPNLEHVHLIDNNHEALLLCELKLVALRQLSVEEYLAFIGFGPPDKDRWTQFQAIKAYISKDCREYWETRKVSILAGICNCGHFEQFLRRANPMLRFFLGRQFYQCFTSKKAAWQHFPSFRWSIVKALFSHRWAYRIFGMKDPAFISRDAALRSIPDALQESMDKDKANESCLFHLIFKGDLKDMPENNLPPSFQKDVLNHVKTALMGEKLKVYFHCNDLLAVISGLEFEPDKNVFFSFSDVLSFADMEYLKHVFRRIMEYKSVSNTLIFRSFVRNRLSAFDLQNLQEEFGAVSDLSTEERTHFYQVFQIDL
jgi:S-adenosylmethionine-diacylglycerol 3-amino-3-carboxypropyl transferase